MKIANLTSRELEISQLVAKGLSNSEIATRLQLSTRTIESYLSFAYSKLHIKNRVQLTLWVQENLIEALCQI